MENVRLMRRTDTKFVFSKEKLPEILEKARNDYYMVEIANEREQIYETTYFDTCGYDMYSTHHNGKLNRFKVRIRKYIYSNMAFLEVKAKNNKGETIKNRIKYKQPDINLDHNTTSEFLNKYTPYNPVGLKPMLGNKFIRLTLVNKNLTERITLDYHLSFEDLTYKQSTVTNDVCIAEIKKDRDTRDSMFIGLLRDLRIKSMGFSKYCMGMALLNPDIKNNRFKERIRKLEKLA